MGKKSSRAQQREYSPVSTFKPNEDAPKDASEMDKAKREAKKADAVSKSAVLRALKEEKDKKGKKEETKK